MIMLSAIKLDLRQLKVGPSNAWKKAASRKQWRSIRTRLCTRRVCLEDRQNGFVFYSIGLLWIDLVRQ